MKGIILAGGSGSRHRPSMCSSARDTGTRVPSALPGPTMQPSSAS